MWSLSQALACHNPVPVSYLTGALKVDGQACRIDHPIHAKAAGWLCALMRVLPAELVALDALAPPHADGILDNDRLRTRLADVPAALSALPSLRTHGAAVHTTAIASLAAPMAVGPVLTVTARIAIHADDGMPMHIDAATYAGASAAISDIVAAALRGQTTWMLASGLRAIALNLHTRG